MRNTIKVVIERPAVPAKGEYFEGDKKIPAQPAIPKGRDHGKVFVLTEMPATEAEPWATKAALLLAKAAGTELPDDAQGVAALASLDTKQLPSLVKLKVAQALQDPSLDAWWNCVQYQHDPQQMPQKIIHGDGCQIEDISTISFLRAKVLELHTSFFPQGGQ